MRETDLVKGVVFFSHPSGMQRSLESIRGFEDSTPGYVLTPLRGALQRLRQASARRVIKTKVATTPRARLEPGAPGLRAF